jgi:hypothetical protein
MRYIELLSPDEYERYASMRGQFSSSVSRFQRNRRLALLQDELSAIRTFCVCASDDGWRRYLACGICWLTPTRIAVNCKQLAFTIAKSKSSVNGMLTQLGYALVPLRRSDAHCLQTMIPHLARRPNEMRHWVLRERAPVVVAAPPEVTVGLAEEPRMIPSDDNATSDCEWAGDDLCW